MARNSEKIIQLLRSSNIYTPTIVEGVETTSALDNAIASFDALLNSPDLELLDGEVMLARYQETGKDVKAVLAAYTNKDGNTGFTYYIDSVAINQIVNELVEKVDEVETRTTVSAGDESVNVDVEDTGTTVSVNVDWENEAILKLGNDGIYTDVNLVKVIPNGEASEGVIVDANLNVNVREAYRLMSGNDQIGQQIDIYKDSALKEIWLGSEYDTVDTTTGAITKFAWQSKNDPTNRITNEAYQQMDDASKANYEPLDLQSLNYVYQLADGTYTLVSIDVSKFLTETEFGNGLVVDSATHTVSVLIDPTSESFLTVSASGIKLDGVQAAINAEAARAQASESEIAGLVGLTGNEGEREWTPTTNYGTGTTSVKENMESIADRLAEIDATVSGTVYNSTDAIAVTRVQGTDNEYDISLVLSEESDNVLEIKNTGNKGAYLSGTWDCGEY